MAHKAKRKRRRSKRIKRRPKKKRRMIRYKIVGGGQKDYFKVTWHDNLLFNPAAGAMSVNVFRTNSCFDPNLTGGAHQPRGWSQLTNLYTTYRVIRSVCHVDFCKQGGVTVPYVCGIARRALPGVEGGLIEYIEQKGCVFKNSSGRQTNKTSLTLTWNAKKAFPTGVDPTLTAANMTNDPTTTHHFHVFYAGLSLADNPEPIIFSIRLTYYVLLRRTDDMGASG